jgi:hypothetical protein
VASGLVLKGCYCRCRCCHRCCCGRRGNS